MDIFYPLALVIYLLFSHISLNLLIWANVFDHCDSCSFPYAHVMYTCRLQHAHGLNVFPVTPEIVPQIKKRIPSHRGKKALCNSPTEHQFTDTNTCYIHITGCFACIFMKPILILGDAI